MSSLSKQAFLSVSRLFESVSGIKLAENTHELVTGRLQKLAMEAGESSLDGSVEKLLRGNAPAEELTRLVDRLTTHETYFFREPQHFNDFAARLEAQPAGKEFRVWSAASSSGEEAFSAAMLMADVLGSSPWQVIGTDLSNSVVEAAQRGLYTLDRARMVPPGYLKRFCLEGQGEHQGKLLITRELRERVRFLGANLMHELPPLPKFDVIFLRNVLICFDNHAKCRIVRRVLTQLKPDGVLYTGHAESLAALTLPLKPLGSAIHGHA